LKIKNKRYQGEDFKRYKIKDWDIDNQIDKLFEEEDKDDK